MRLNKHPAHNPLDGVNYFSYPDQKGHFGQFGGRFVSETLMAALQDLEKLYANMKNDAEFLREFDHDMAHYVGRPSPLYHAERWSRELGGAQIYLKREDLNPQGGFWYKQQRQENKASLRGTANLLPPGGGNRQISCRRLAAGGRRKEFAHERLGNSPTGN